MPITIGTTACTATNHCGENFFTPARQYPNGRLSTKVAAMIGRYCTQELIVAPIRSVRGAGHQAVRPGDAQRGDYADRVNDGLPHPALPRHLRAALAVRARREQG